jgi:uncharacterized membrane protein required for colicin V production
LNTFDLIILGLLFFGGIAGFQKGLITGLSRFVGKIAAIVIAVVFIASFLRRWNRFLVCERRLSRR